MDNGHSTLYTSLSTLHSKNRLLPTADRHTSGDVEIGVSGLETGTSVVSTRSTTGVLLPEPVVGSSADCKLPTAEFLPHSLIAKKKVIFAKTPQQSPELLSYRY